MGGAGVSTKQGLAPLIAEAAAAAKTAMDAREAELQQLELEDPLTGEELLEAKGELGLGAGRLAVVAKARENRRGRPPGAKNRSTEDMRRYLLQFGPDPLVGAMRLQAEDPLILAELWGCKPLEVVDRQLRARELVSPYMHSKKPVAVDMAIRGVRVVEEIGNPDAATLDIEGDFVRVVSPDDEDEAAA